MTVTDQSGAPTSYTCPWCRMSSTGAATTCPSCGAPVDVQLRTTDSGWTQLPAIPDMAKIQFGQSSCQIEGLYVPAADLDLAAGERVYFSHHNLLWQDPSVSLSTMSLKGAWNRMMAGLPLIMLEATGPGHLAVSRDAPGEVVAIPLQAGNAVDVRENHFLVATSNVGYDWLDSGVWFTTSGSGGGARREGAGMKLLKMGLDAALEGSLDIGGDTGGGGGGETEWHYPLGRYLDRFVASERPGLVLMHAAGNAFVRNLGPDETILVKPPAFLFKDPTVRFQLHVEYPAAGMKFWRSWGNRYLWVRLWGPGRVALQSSYERLEDPGSDFTGTSGHTEYRW